MWLGEVYLRKDPRRSNSCREHLKGWTSASAIWRSPGDGSSQEGSLEQSPFPVPVNFLRRKLSLLNYSGLNRPTSWRSRWLQSELIYTPRANGR